jgi:hypothetical protein
MEVKIWIIPFGLIFLVVGFTEASAYQNAYQNLVGMAKAAEKDRGPDPGSLPTAPTILRRDFVILPSSLYPRRIRAPYWKLLPWRLRRKT